MAGQREMVKCPNRRPRSPGGSVIEAGLGVELEASALFSNQRAVFVLSVMPAHFFNSTCKLYIYS